MASRKAKHLPQFRGPATVVKVRSSTTYDIEYKGRTFSRCVSELHRYKSDKDHALTASTRRLNKFAGGSIHCLHRHRRRNRQTAYLLSRRQVCQHRRRLDPPASNGHNREGVITCNLEAVVATQVRQICPDAGNNSTQQVTDKIPVEDVDGYVHHYNLHLQTNGKLAQKTRKQLENANVTHHRVGKTFR